MGAWKEHQNHNLKQNLNHNLKQNLNPIPLLGIHHTLVATTSQMLIQGHGIGMDSQISTEETTDRLKIMDFWTMGTSSSAGAVGTALHVQVSNGAPMHQTEQK